MIGLCEEVEMRSFTANTLIKRMSRRPRQLGVRDPDVLLLLPLLARPHRHAPILRTKSVDTSEVFVYESGLAPRAVRAVFEQLDDERGGDRRGAQEDSMELWR